MKYFFFLSLMLIFIVGCKKTDTTVVTPIVTECDVRGTYYGTAVGSTGASTTNAYKLQDNNFAVGSVTLASPAVSFGGYRNTCDSIIISIWYSGSGNYYLFQGKFSNNRVTLSGTFKNLTDPTNFGTFSFTKQ